MKIRLLLLSVLLVAGCSKPQVAPSSTAASPPAQATPAPASQNSSTARESDGTAAAVQAAPPTASAPVAAPSAPVEIAIAGRYDRAVCLNGQLMFAQTVEFSGTDDGDDEDTAEMKILEDYDGATLRVYKPPTIWKGHYSNDTGIGQFKEPNGMPDDDLTSWLNIQRAAYTWSKSDNSGLLMGGQPDGAGGLMMNLFARYNKGDHESPRGDYKFDICSNISTGQLRAIQ